MKVMVLEANADAYTRFVNFLDYVNAHKDVNARHYVSADYIANYMSSDELNNFVDYLMKEFDIDESDINY